MAKLRHFLPSHTVKDGTAVRCGRQLKVSFCGDLTISNRLLATQLQSFVPSLSYGVRQLGV